MSGSTVLTFKGAMSDVTLHFVQNVLIERFQRFREFPRCLSVEGVYAVGEHEVHIVEGHRLTVAVCILARRSCALRNDTYKFFHVFKCLSFRSPLRPPPKGERLEADLNLPPFGGIRGGPNVQL